MTSRGFLTRTPTGVAATLHDKWGYVHTLTGTPAERDGVKGYDIEVVMTAVPAELAVPGDGDYFEIKEIAG